jgi:hypothetical protein
MRRSGTFLIGPAHLLWPFVPQELGIGISPEPTPVLRPVLEEQRAGDGAGQPLGPLARMRDVVGEIP